MKISTATSIISQIYSIEDTVRMICEAGYDAIDMTLYGVYNYFERDNRAEIIKNLKSIVSSYGVRFNQAHAPFGGGYERYKNELVYKMPSVLEFAGELGVDAVVVHPVHDGAFLGDEERHFDINMKLFSDLAPYAKDAGVKIAIENMWQKNPTTQKIGLGACGDPLEHCKYYDALGDPDAFTVCLDLGHVALCAREPEDAIRTLGASRLGALHVSDCDYAADLHTLPGLGKINWDNVCHALADIEYRGTFTYEANGFLKNLVPEQYPSAIKLMVDTARYLTGKIEKYKAEK